MRTGEQKVARAYVIYREQRSEARKQAGANHHPTLQITDAHVIAPTIRSRCTYKIDNRSSK